MKSRSRKEDYQRKVEIGYKRMKNYKVAVCSIVRDCANNLKANIPVIDSLSNCFGESHVVVFENDSKDKTRDLLCQWANRVPSVNVLSEELNINTMPHNTRGVRAWFSSVRIKNMASYRNRYLEFLEKSGWELDYVIVVDLDLKSICIDGVANSFGQDLPWDAITSNGKKAAIRGYLYYDTYAFREIDDHSPQTLDALFTYQTLLSGLYIGMPMIRVASGFNGLTIYRAEAIKGLRYRCEPNNDENVEAKVCHLTLHQDMKNNGYERIYINPSQIVYYDTYYSVIKTLLRKFNKRLFYSTTP